MKKMRRKRQAQWSQLSKLALFYIIGIWFRLVDKCLKQILTMSKIKSNAPALLYFSACKNVTRYIIF